MERSFAVVEFTEESTVEVVSTQWLDKSKSFCFWPSSSGPSLRKLVTTHCKPGKDWKLYKCRVLRVYADYTKARKGAAKAERTDNLDTSGIEGGTPKKRKRIRSVLAKSIPKKNPKPLRQESSSDSLSSSDSSPEFNIPNTTLTVSPPIPVQSSTSSQSITLDRVHIVGNDPNVAIPQNSPGTNSGFLADAEGQEHYLIEIPGLMSDTPGISTAHAPEVHAHNLGQLDEIQAENRRFQSAVLNKLVDIHADVREILRRTTPTQSEPVLDIPKLPVDTVAELDELNIWLSVEENSQKLKRELSYIGGSTISSITQRILARLIGNQLAVKISLTGKGKLAEGRLKDSLLQLVIYESVRKTKGGGAAQNYEIDSAIKVWLKNASDRCGGRERRRQKKEEEQKRQSSNQSCSSRQNAQGNDSSVEK